MIKEIFNVDAQFWSIFVVDIVTDIYEKLDEWFPDKSKNGVVVLEWWPLYY